LQQRAQLPATKFLASVANNCGSRQILCFLRRVQSFARPTSHRNGYYEPATTAEIIQQQHRMRRVEENFVRVARCYYARKKRKKKKKQKIHAYFD